MTTTSIEPGQVWRSDSLGMELRIKAVSERRSSYRQGSLWVEYIVPTYANAAGSNRMTKQWLRTHYKLVADA